ncbi:phage tail assembly chaperone [Geminicoccus flavidas]|uniref:phage tail assembly chaperone n=1 Tax=Geminicoccus flavidas TaxID=2506407 RepID=UPI00135CCCD8|nr:phage tail assembly chaperone [Geminicoccus flavidas]
MENSPEMFFSATANAFYPSAFRADYEAAGTWPEDAVAVPYSTFQEFALDAAPAGKERVVGPDGLPMWADLPAPSVEQLAAAARAERDTALKATDWLVARHRDEVDAGGKTALTADQFKALLAYRKTLRDLPNKKGFPAVAMPKVPDFL